MNERERERESDGDRNQVHRFRSSNFVFFLESMFMLM